MTMKHENNDFFKTHLTPSKFGSPPAGAESFRVPRQVEEEKGTIATVVDTLKSYYDQSVDTASGYAETIKGYKLNEKAK